MFDSDPVKFNNALRVLYRVASGQTECVGNYYIAQPLSHGSMTVGFVHDFGIVGVANVWFAASFKPEPVADEGEVTQAELVAALRHLKKIHDTDACFTIGDKGAYCERFYSLGISLNSGAQDDYFAVVKFMPRVCWDGRLGLPGAFKAV